MGRVTWYARRLQTMSVPEIGWRVASAVRRRVGLTERRRPLDGWTREQWERSLADFRVARDRPRLLDRERARDIVDRSPAVVAGVVGAADRAIGPEVQFFGYPAVRLGQPVDWNHDPVGGVDWPVGPASGIDHRTSAGDPKWIWELNRLQHLPSLSQAWLFTDDDRYAEAVFDQLDSWVAQNPPGTGIAWRGAFEAGIRAISVVIALGGVRDCDALDVDRYRVVMSILDASARRCVADRSRHSSANNHLVGELAGLAVIAIACPDLPGAARWEATAVGELVTQAALQILPDGVGAEQAVGYQIFTAELLLVVAALLHDRDGYAPPALLAAVDRGAEFLAAMGDPAPRFGDDDEGVAVRLGPEPTRTVAAHLDLVAGLHDGPSADETTAERAWFARLDSHPRVSQVPSTAMYVPDGSAMFPDGGLVVLRSGGRRLTMDVGPLGYLAIAAHGHADALAVTVAVDGHDIIGDPGTASYYGHPDWRVAMRGTAAHPTVTIDDTDQSEIGGAFMWTRHARTRLRAVDLERGIIDAEHHGYERLKDPVVHRRWVIATPDLDEVLIVDLISGRGVHDIATTWPLHPDLDIVGVADGHDVFRGTSRVARILSVGTAALEHHAGRGRHDAQIGWWSRRLESRESSWWIGARANRVKLPFVAISFIDVTNPSELRYDLSVTQRDGCIAVRWSSQGVRRTVVIDTMGDGHVRVREESAM